MAGWRGTGGATGTYTQQPNWLNKTAGLPSLSTSPGGPTSVTGIGPTGSILGAAGAAGKAVAAGKANGFQPTTPGGTPTDISTPPPAAPFSDAYGSESGPGILEQRFNNRLNGTDASYNYAVKRGLTDLDNRYSAAGSFNSGAARQGEGDLVANLTAKSQAEIDALAGGASGEHQGKVNSMFNQGLGLAGGQAGTAGAYDLGAGNAMSAANQAALMLALQKAGVDSQAAQGFINNLMGGVSLAAGINNKKP